MLARGPARHRGDLHPARARLDLGGEAGELLDHSEVLNKMILKKKAEIDAYMSQSVRLFAC